MQGVKVDNWLWREIEVVNVMKVRDVKIWGCVPGTKGVALGGISS